MSSEFSYRKEQKRVDVESTARDALSQGIFAEDADAVKKNRFYRDPIHHYPTSKLDPAYGNGPAQIHDGIDLSERLVFAAYTNIAEANNILAPAIETKKYFDQRFEQDTVLQNPELAQIVTGYVPHRISSWIPNGHSDSEVAFRTEGVKRRVNNRKLYTLDEGIAGLNLARLHPQVVLSVLTYQGVMKGYFNDLQAEFNELRKDADNGINKKDMENFREYKSAWDSNNFTNELIPAMGIFYTLRKSIDQTTPDERLIDQTMFHDAMEFIRTNGAFRQWVRVPQMYSQTGIAHTIHFSCPAQKMINEQLEDGAILSQIYTKIQDKQAAGDDEITRNIQTIKGKIDRSYRDLYPGGNIISLPTGDITVPFWQAM